MRMEFNCAMGQLAFAIVPYHLQADFSLIAGQNARGFAGALCLSFWTQGHPRLLRIVVKCNISGVELLAQDMQTCWREVFGSALWMLGFINE